MHDVDNDVDEDEDDDEDWDEVGDDGKLAPNEPTVNSDDNKTRSESTFESVGSLSRFIAAKSQKSRSSNKRNICQTNTESQCVCVCVRPKSSSYNDNKR